jgi:SAM-dependent methyltransferase
MENSPGIEIDLMASYPRTKRDFKQRATEKTSEDRAIARQFGREFFDGDRRNGYGGFSYDPRFWTPVVPAFKRHFSLKPEDLILDVGCAKGFMLHDFHELIPGLEVKGIDVSEYAIEHALDSMKPYVSVGDARALPFPDDSFDVAISVTTIHNFNREDCIVALQEIERVSRRGAFVTVDAYRTEEERTAMDAWNLTALTVLHVDEWKELFSEAGYSGDYYWFMP